MNYIYLIYPGRFAEHNNAVYKIGKTTRSPDKRILEYENGTEVILITRVDDCNIMERQILKLFDELFVKRTEYGLEYYSGDVNKMQNEIFRLITKENIHIQTRKEKEIIKVNIKSYKEKLQQAKENPPAILEGLIHLAPNESDEYMNINSDENHLEEFIEYIKHEKPTWFKEGQWIKKALLSQKYNDKFGKVPYGFYKLTKNILWTLEKRNTCGDNLASIKLVKI